MASEVGDQSLYDFLRDSYYNLKFKRRNGVISPKQIAMSMEPILNSYGKTTR